MSAWTTVRILYDVSKSFNRKKCFIYEDAYSYIDLAQCLKTAHCDLKYKKKSIFDLGSEGCVTIKLIPIDDANLSYGKETLDISESGYLIMVGNLRDCTKDEFVLMLNEYIKQLNSFGIQIDSGLVRIE